MDKIQLERMNQRNHGQRVSLEAFNKAIFYPTINAFGKEMYLWDVYDEEECPMWDSFGTPNGAFVHKGGRYHGLYLPLLHNDTRKSRTL
tara:strand:+ start:344 stop:610 length:267 start_codon:yes stop_codon:yes gene_type:complete